MRMQLEGTRRTPLAVVAAALALLLLGLTASPTQASVTPGDYLPKSVVKAKMGGSGTWYRSVADRNLTPLGADPAACRSDIPLTRARETRSAYYWGAMPATTEYYGIVQVTVAEFRSKRAAKRAMRKISKWVPACPTVVEWTCTECDGIAQFDRKPAKRRKVGTQSYAWKERTVSLGASNGKAIAARRGRTVVIVVASHQTDPVTMATPSAPTWRTTVKLARRSLARATS